MKPLLSIPILLGLLLAPLPAAARQGERGTHDSEVQATLTTLERQRASAIVRRDIPVLRQLMDRHYYHVMSRGRVRSKTELLTALERDEFRFRVYDLESVEVQVLEGGNVALVTGIFRSMQVGGPARPFRGRYAHVWVRQPEGWKNTFHQATEIRPAQEPCQCD